MTPIPKTKLSSTTSCQRALPAGAALAVLAAACVGCAASRDGHLYDAKVARLSERTVSIGAAVQCRGGTLQSAADATAYVTCDRVTGDLLVTHSSLSSLDVLSRLRSVSGTLEISDNPELDDLRGLTQLSSVGRLVVHGNPDLSSLAGLGSLRRAATVSITDNADLENLKGLEGLEYIEDLRIERNGILDTVGFANLSGVGTLVIKSNSKLVSLRGFKGLTRAEFVQIQDNPLLAGYYGFLPQLQRVGQLVLSHNLCLSKNDVRNMLERVEQGADKPMVATQEDRREAAPR
jgi:hypothetical protein